MKQPNSSLKGKEEVTGEQLDEAMSEMECWSVDNHLKECKKHFQDIEKKTREEVFKLIDEYPRLVITHKDGTKTRTILEHSLDQAKQVASLKE